MTKQTILLVDNYPAWFDILHYSLRRIPDLVVKGRVGSKHKALVVIEEKPPDILVLDVKLSDGCGLGLCQDISKQDLPTTALILTAYDEDVYLARALAGGAVGYLLKTKNVMTIIDAIQRALQGEILWAHDQLLRVRHWRQVAGDKWNTLTEREREVVTGLAYFKRNAEIAEELNISVHTVRHHLSHIFKKLGMTDRLEVARWAIRHKLIEW